MRYKNIFLFLFGIFTLLFLYGCSFDKFNDYLNDYVKRNYDSMEQKQKKLFTLDNFKSISEKFGYEIEDVKDFDKSTIKTLTLAKKSNCQIEFYVTKDNKVSINLFNFHKKDLKKQNKKSDEELNEDFDEKSENDSLYTGENAITGEHSDYFSVQIRNDYMVIYRFYNYFIYLRSDLSNKKESKKILKELGCYDTIYLCLDSAFQAFVKCLFDKPSKSTKKENVFVETPEQFREIASLYGFKTYEEGGLKSEDYKIEPKTIHPKIKRTTILIDGADINNLSTSKFIEFEDVFFVHCP